MSNCVIVSAEQFKNSVLKPIPKPSYFKEDWYVGTTPLNVDYEKLPIVFVQGKNEKATAWYENTVYHGKNNMYEAAYQAGYRTAFVQLYDASDSKSYSPFDNGKLLAQQLQEISNHFKQKINIVAHSKGGIDTQAALVYYGAHQFVNRIITLGSPHYGSPLADLAFSWWAQGISTLLNHHDEGTFALQTGEMAHFRKIIDTNPIVRYNEYFTASGINTGPPFSALSLGGRYLSLYGKNDGLVNEWSTMLPYGKHIFSDESLDHDSLRTEKIFSRIEPILRNNLPLMQGDSTPFIQKKKTVRIENQTVFGGELLPNNKYRNVFFMDRGAQGKISILTTSKNNTIKLVSPCGKIWEKEDATQIKGGMLFFKEAFIQEFNIQDMEPGKWLMEIQSGQKDAYLFIAKYNSPPPFQIEFPDNIKINQEKTSIQFINNNTDGTKNGNEDNGLFYGLSKQPCYTKIHRNIEKNPISSGQYLEKNQVDENYITIRVLDPNGAIIIQCNGIQELNQQLQHIKETGLYNFTFDINGKNTEGYPYTRTIVKSIYLEK